MASNLRELEGRQRAAIQEECSPTVFREETHLVESSVPKPFAQYSSNKPFQIS
jgi:hypothetical protein